MKKRGQGLSLQMVVIAVIVLVVLAVIFVLIGKSTSTFISGNNCQPFKGKCEKPADCKGPTANYDGCVSPKICCLKLGG
jgi:hypothetical protein